MEQFTIYFGSQQLSITKFKQLILEINNGLVHFDVVEAKLMRIQEKLKIIQYIQQNEQPNNKLQSFWSNEKSENVIP